MEEIEKIKKMAEYINDVRKINTTSREKFIKLLAELWDYLSEHVKDKYVRYDRKGNLVISRDLLTDIEIAYKYYCEEK